MTQQSEPLPPEWSALPNTTWTAPPPLPPPSKSRSTTAVTLDIVGTVLGWVALLLAAAGAAFISLFFVMITDSCTGGPECDLDLVEQGAGIVWIGDAAALLTALVGTVICAVKRRYMFYWPLIGVVIVVVGLWVGVSMAEAGGPQR